MDVQWTRSPNPGTDISTYGYYWITVELTDIAGEIIHVVWPVWWSSKHWADHDRWEGSIVAWAKMEVPHACID